MDRLMVNDVDASVVKLKKQQQTVILNRTLSAFGCQLSKLAFGREGSTFTVCFPSALPSCLRSSFNVRFHMPPHCSLSERPARPIDLSFTASQTPCQASTCIKCLKKSHRNSSNRCNL